MMITKVKCEICNKIFRSITASHLAHHGITLREYMDKFPDSPIHEEALEKPTDSKNLLLDALRKNFRN